MDTGQKIIISLENAGWQFHCGFNPACVRENISLNIPTSDLEELPESRNNFREVRLSATSRKLFLLSGSCKWVCLNLYASLNQE